MVGIIGGGQLARMMYEASIRLGCEVRILSSGPEGATSIARGLTVADHADSGAVVAFARECDVVTFDHELVPAPVLAALDGVGAAVRPTSASYSVASDKSSQRDLAKTCGLAVAPGWLVSTSPEFFAAARDLGLPLVAKRSRGGYDGRGLLWVASEDALAEVGRVVDADDVGWIVEPELPIDAELAVVVARRANGEVAVYPVTATVQRAGTCRTVLAPAPHPAPMVAEVAESAVRLAEELDHVGVLALETFVVDGTIVFNEIAPRPHNSGHYTIDACAASQFENHLRAVLDYPLGPTELVVPAAAMANLIAGPRGITPLCSVPVPAGASIHLYGKQRRPGRKVGHVTVCGRRGSDVLQTAVELADRLTPQSDSPGERVA